MPRSEANSKYYLVLCICLAFEQTDKSMYFYVAITLPALHTARMDYNIEWDNKTWISKYRVYAKSYSKIEVRRLLEPITYLSHYNHLEIGHTQ